MLTYILVHILSSFASPACSVICYFRCKSNYYTTQDTILIKRKRKTTFCISCHNHTSSTIFLTTPFLFTTPLQVIHLIFFDLLRVALLISSAITQFFSVRIVTCRCKDAVIALCNTFVVHWEKKATTPSC